MTLDEKLDLIQEAYFTFGVQAARELMWELGFPMPPKEIWDPIEVLEEQRLRLLRPN